MLAGLILRDSPEATDCCPSRFDRKYILLVGGRALPRGTAWDSLNARTSILKIQAAIHPKGKWCVPPEFWFGKTHWRHYLVDNELFWNYCGILLHV